MLMYFTLPASFGFMGYYDNIGNVMNAGVEVELHGDIISTRLPLERERQPHLSQE